MLKTPPKPKVPIECKTPIAVAVAVEEAEENQYRINNSSSDELLLRKPPNVTPDRLRLPKPFKYPERYTSPTDLMVSPVTKGLIARSKRGGKYQQKDVGPFQNKLPVLIDEKINST